MDHFIEMTSLSGKKVQAKVGDEVLCYCGISKKVRRTKIKGIKKGFRTGLKITPKPWQCLWLKSK